MKASRRLKHEVSRIRSQDILRERHWSVFALVNLRCFQPLLQEVQAIDCRAHRHYLKAIHLIEHLLNRVELDDDCFEQEASLLVLHHVQLVNNDELDVEVAPLFDQLVYKAVGFFNGANGQVHVRSPLVLRL